MNNQAGKPGYCTHKEHPSKETEPRKLPLGLPQPWDTTYARKTVANIRIASKTPLGLSEAWDFRIGEPIGFLCPGLCKPKLDPKHIYWRYHSHPTRWYSRHCSPATVGDAWIFCEASHNHPRETNWAQISLSSLIKVVSKNVLLRGKRFPHTVTQPLIEKTRQFP